MEPRLQRLIELWDRSLEQGLDAAGRRELEGLLADAPLCEQLTQWQSAAAYGEADPPAETPRLDAAVRAAFRNRVAMKRWLPWILAAGLGAAGLMAWSAASGDGRTRALAVAVEDQPDRWVEPQAQPTPRRSLGLPPGYGQRPSRLLGLGRSVSLDFRAPGAVPVRVEVVDASDHCVRTLMQGDLPLGPASRTWDGKDDAGRALPRGSYRLRARTYTELLAEKQVELSPAP
jgi:hypothetical protein